MRVSLAYNTGLTSPCKINLQSNSINTKTLHNLAAKHIYTSKATVDTFTFKGNRETNSENVSQKGKLQLINLSKTNNNYKTALQAIDEELEHLYDEPEYEYFDEETQGAKETRNTKEVSNNNKENNSF